MRLTLRTLLAWMDDTLSAAEVREIGKQMTESPFARELVDKINKVARQRRLTVPTEQPPDGIDPNIVAAYLDNELDSELVSEYEKRCLTSDVTLAEVASIHQILSLIGQKAKVPPEARHRIYRLVKGREASRTDVAGAFTSHRKPEPVETPAKPAPASWGSSMASTRSWGERLGLGAAVLGLMALLIFTAMKSLEPEVVTKPIRPAEAVAVKTTQKEDRRTRVVPDDEDAGIPKLGGPGGSTFTTAKPKAKPAEDPTATTPPETEKTAAPAETGRLKVDKIEGVLLTRSNQNDVWKPVDPKVDPVVGDHLLNLSPQWITLHSGTTALTLVGVAEVSVAAPAEGLKVIQLQLEQGRAVVRDISRDQPFEILVHGRAVKISTQGATPVGLELRPAAISGAAEVPPPTLHVSISEGEATLRAGTQTKSLSGPSGVSLLPTDQFAESSKGPAPTWMTDPAPSAFDSQISERFAKTILRPGRPVLASLVEALTDEDKEMRRLSITALAALGQAELVVPLLNESNDPATRKGVVEALRSLLSRSPSTRKAVRTELEKTFGSGADSTEKMLVGYTPEEAKDEATLVRLVQLLTAPELGTRALAIDSLRTLTGRDSLDYDPTRPEGKGLNAWKELVATKKVSGKEKVPAIPMPPR